MAEEIVVQLKQESRGKGLFDYIQVIATLLIPAAITFIGIHYTNSSAQVAQNIQKMELAGKYLEMIGGEKFEDEKRSFLLSILLKDNVVDVNTIFKMAYRHSYRYGSDIIKDLFYEYDLRHRHDANAEKLYFPLGIIDFPAKLREQRAKDPVNFPNLFLLQGWVLDDAEIDYLDVWFSGDRKRYSWGCSDESANRCTPQGEQFYPYDLKTGQPRPDLKSYFKHSFDDIDNRGFVVRVNQAYFEDRETIPLKIRMVNKNGFGVYIFNGQLILKREGLDEPYLLQLTQESQPSEPELEKATEAAD